MTDAEFLTLNEGGEYMRIIPKVPLFTKGRCNSTKRKKAYTSLFALTWQTHRRRSFYIFERNKTMGT